MHLGGAARPSLVEHELLLEAEELPSSGLDPEDAEAPTRQLDELREKGLVQADRDHRELFLAPELLSPLADLMREELSASLHERHAVAPVFDEHALLCAFNVVRQRPVPLTQAGRPHRRFLDQLGERLAALLPRDGGADAVEELLATLRCAGLLRLARDGLRADLTAAREWAGAEPELRTGHTLAGHDGPLEAELLLAQLRRLPDRGLPVPLSRLLWRRVLARQVPGGSAAFAETARRSHDLAVLALSRAGLLGATPGDDGEDELVLTVLGRDDTAAAPAPRPTGFHVGPDLSLLVPRGLDPLVHLHVGALARLEAGDVVARYHLDRAVVLDALDHGETAEGLHAFLAEHAEPMLPASVAEDLARWCSRFGEVSSHEGRTFVCSAPARRAEFAALVERSAARARLVAEGVAVVAVRDADTFHGELVAAGFTPRRRVVRFAREESSLAHEQLPRTRPDEVEELRSRESLPTWDRPTAWSTDRRASPPPGLLRRRLADKYRREFGRAALLALEELSVEELLDHEEAGLMRRFLSGQDVSVGSSPRGGSEDATVESDLLDPRLDELRVPEPVPLTPRRAAAALERAAADGLSCELDFRGEGGRRTRLTVEPLGLLAEAGIRYLRGRSGPGGEERLVALDRILALRVV